MNNKFKQQIIEKVGFFEQDIDPSLDLFEEIQDLKKQKNAVILAHFYQDADIQDVSDFIGDSLGLAREALQSSADIIVFAGVHFMAETAKILNPTRRVLVPDLKAGCSLSDSCPPSLFERFRKDHPDHTVITYINCSAQIKALSDVICTSSNAKKIVESFPEDHPIIFAPDKNLGAYLNVITNRKMLLWNGACMVHEIFSQRKINLLREKYPKAEVIVHPECETTIIELADFIGSTNQLIDYTIKSNIQQFIVVTESGIIHQMKKKSPYKEFIPAPPDNACACNNCPHMKLNTLEKLYLCLKNENPEITMSNDLLEKALIPMQRMIELS